MTNRRLPIMRAAAAIGVAATAGLLGAGITNHPAAANGRANATQSKASTLRLVARQNVFQFVDNPPSGDSAGDLVVISDNVYDGSGRQLLGRNHVTGIETVPGKTIALTATLSLARGEIALQGITTEQNNRPFSLAITGGTGAYRDAAGVAHIVPTSRTLSHMTFSIERP